MSKYIIYDNYDIDKYYEEAKENLACNDFPNPSEIAIWNEETEIDATYWDAAKSFLEEFFDGATWIISGVVERWDRNYPAGHVFREFTDAYYKATVDCDYVRIYEEAGHLYLTCSHHDGTNQFEIRKLTEKGIKYLENYESGRNYNDHRNLKEVHEKLWKNYSVLPRFVKATGYYQEKEAA